MTVELTRIEHLKMHALHDMVFNALGTYRAPPEMEDARMSPEWFSKNWANMVRETMEHLANCDITYPEEELEEIHQFLVEAEYQWVGEGLGIVY